MSHTPLEPESVSASGEPGPVRRARVEAAARAWQRALADLGGPNTLLWHRDLPSGTLDLTTAHPGGVSMLMAGRATRLSDLVREPSAFAEARRRAEAIRDKAAELYDERGLVTGFMAIGMATWTVPGSRRAPSAPVLLRACTLHPTGPAHRDYDIDLSDGVELNPVLVHYLASERGVRLDAEAIADVAHVATRFDPVPVFRELTRLCRDVPGFRVADRKIVDTFPYAKLAMVADVAALGDDLARHELLAVLAGETPAVGSAERPAPRPVPPERLILDADADQRDVIDAVRAGAHARVLAPPGTGRTQTIANLVAALAADGRSTLVVSQKRARLERLLARLDGVGLRGLALDLGPGALDRGGAARDIRANLQTLSGRAAAADEETRQRIAAAGAVLDDHRDALHEHRSPWDVTVFEALSALTRLTRGRRPPTSRVRLEGAALEVLDRPTVERAGALLAEAAVEGAWAEAPVKDPWAGARITTSEEAGRVGDLTRELVAGRLDSETALLDGLLRAAGLPAANRAEHWAEALALLDDVRGTLATMTPGVYSHRLQDYLLATGDRTFRREHGSRLPWWTRWRLRREARTLVVPDRGAGNLHATLAAAADEQSRWRRLSGGASTPRVPDGLEEACRTWQALRDDLLSLSGPLENTAEGGDLLATPLPDLRRRLALLAGRGDRLQVLPTVVPLLDQLADLGFGPLTDDLAARRVPVENVIPELEFVCWRSILDAIGAADPRVGEHDGPALRARLEEYVRLDSREVRTGAAEVAARVERRLAAAVEKHPGQVSAVLADVGRQRRPVPVRDFLAAAPEVARAARPCWVMSPLVAASVLPTTARFDVVVLDEAAGLSAPHVVSAIARADQVLLVGDPTGLPPSGFSTSAELRPADREDLVPATSAESVLDQLESAVPEHALCTHYGAQDERLVAFANAHLHGGRLRTFPGVLDPDCVAFVAVDIDDEAAVDDAAAGDAPLPEEGPAPGRTDIAADTPPDLRAREVDAVVRQMLDHVRQRPEESLGVVTLTERHARAVVEGLRRALDTERDPRVVDFFGEAHAEAPFVRPLERAQGDLRDAILLSVGFPPATGAGAHRFGPIGLDGGEQRLGVAVAGARRRLTVVSCLRPEHLERGRLASRGTAMLRDLLEYAASRADPAVLRRQMRAGAGADERAAEADDAVLAEFAVRLRQEGLVVHEGYGLSSDPIDLAVEDPYVVGRMVVAVESDGRRYAARPDTRDRERLREGQLARLGWQCVRVWSADVFADPVRDIARVLEAVRTADARRSSGTPSPWAQADGW